MLVSVAQQRGRNAVTAMRRRYRDSHEPPGSAFDDQSCRTDHRTAVFCDEERIRCNIDQVHVDVSAPASAAASKQYELLAGEHNRADNE